MPIPSDTLAWAEERLQALRSTLEACGWTAEGNLWTKGKAQRIDLSRAAQLLKIAQDSEALLSTIPPAYFSKDPIL